MYFAKRGRIPLFSFNELGEKSVNLTIFGKFVNKAIIKLSLPYSFQKLFFISQNLKHLYMTYFWTFDVLFINSRYLAFEVPEVVIQRSSRPGVFCAKSVLKNFANFTGKQLCQSLFFNEVADLRSATLLKRDSSIGVLLRILRNF